jgi:molecular chaperone Hsp33
MQKDRVLRAMTDDGAFRVLTIRSTDTARGICEAQEVRGAAAKQLGELVTASVLVRETMSPAQRAQIVLRDGPGNQLVGDSWPEGHTRGLARLFDDVLGVDLNSTGLLQVTRILHGGRPHQGTVEIDLEGGVATAIMKYFQESEQVVSMVALGCEEDDDGRITAAGGFVVQLLPEVTNPPLAVMTERLRDFADLGRMLAASDADPAHLLSELLYGFAHTELADSEVSFTCHCSYERVLGAVAALGRDTLQEMIDKDETAKVSCDYCREKYEVSPDGLRDVLQRTAPPNDAGPDA